MGKRWHLYVCGSRFVTAKPVEDHVGSTMPGLVWQILTGTRNTQEGTQHGPTWTAVQLLRLSIATGQTQLGTAPVYGSWMMAFMLKPRDAPGKCSMDRTFSPCQMPEGHFQLPKFGQTESKVDSNGCATKFGKFHINYKRC